MAEQIDLPDFVRGDTWVNKVTHPAMEVGDTFWLTLKLDPTVPDSAAPLQVIRVVTSDDVTAGFVALTALAADTAELLPTRYQYDIQHVRGDTVATLVFGGVRVLRDITRGS